MYESNEAFLLHDISLYGNKYKVEQFLYKAASKPRVSILVDLSPRLYRPFRRCESVVDSFYVRSNSYPQSLCLESRETSKIV